MSNSETSESVNYTVEQLEVDRNHWKQIAELNATTAKSALDEVERLKQEIRDGEERLSRLHFTAKRRFHRDAFVIDRLHVAMREAIRAAKEGTPHTPVSVLEAALNIEAALQGGTMKDRKPGYWPDGKFNVREAATYLLATLRIHPDDPDVNQLIAQEYPDIPAYVHPLIQEAMGDLWRFVEKGEDL